MVNEKNAREYGVLIPKTLHFDSLEIFIQDFPTIDVFCNEYNANLTNILVNDEDFPPSGLMYYFDNQIGGYTREGLNNSLDIGTIKTRYNGGDKK